MICATHYGDFCTGMALYHDIAQTLIERIRSGLYPAHQRLPGVRPLAQQLGVSVSTVVQALRLLENRGMVSARPRSGYYASLTSNDSADVPSSPTSTATANPMPVTGQALVMQLARLTHQEGVVQLGAAVPEEAFMPMRAFQRSLSKTVRFYGRRAANYSFPPGLPELQAQLSHRMQLSGSNVDASRILVTNGCQEALSIALQQVTKPGDVVAIESPTFYGLLQVIEALGLQALEIPTDPTTGLSPEALALALEQWPVKACILTPSFSNPLGSKIPMEHKKKLVALSKRFDVVLIEDDVYGDLNFSGERLQTLHSLAPEQVIYCSSVSKTIASGIRIGWMALPDSLFESANHSKYVSTLGVATLPQLALADFFTQGNYERHLRQVRSRYALQIEQFSQAIYRYFPPGTRITQPQGGFVLWIEMPHSVDALKLSHLALAEQISIAPGPIFSASGKYHHCIRINCAVTWSADVDRALLTLGKLANTLT